MPTQEAPTITQTDGLVQGAFKFAATAKVTIQPLRRNVSVLLGAGGKHRRPYRPGRKTPCRCGIVTARPNVANTLATINADPVKQLINTHRHFDHTGGNELLHQAGASILAHENTRKHLSKTPSSQATGNIRSRPRPRVHFPQPLHG